MSLQSEYYNSLVHHGIKGQKWGVRRFETKDGHLTPAGKQRYGDDYEPKNRTERKEAKRERKQFKKDQKLAAKVEQKYSSAGYELGRAQYHRQKEKEAREKHENDAKVLDKTANKYEKEGKFIQAELARKSAAALRARGENVAARSAEKAKRYELSSEQLSQAASKFATKKKVEIGEKSVQKLLQSYADKSKESARANERAERENAIREKLGDKNYATLDKIRGRS